MRCLGTKCLVLRAWCLGVLGAWCLGGAWFLAVPAMAQVEMPDPSLIHGRAIPAAELADGTVTVRVVRENIGNNITDQQVSLTAEGSTRSVPTDDEGRALFTNLPVGAAATAQAVVNGETLTSEPFTVPTSGGLRVILVAGLAQAAERQKLEEANALAAPAEKGIVVLGPNSRIVGEFQDDVLNMFYLLDIQNNARTRVDIGGPFVFDLPSGAGGASAMQGSAPNVTIDDNRITVTGPFAPGITAVQIGFQLRNAGTDYTLEQTFPAAFQQLTFALQKVGTVSMTSAQFGETGEVTADNGVPFVMARGPLLPANAPLVVELSGLPAHSEAPMYTTLTLAGAIVVAGIWLAVARGREARTDRQRLIARRDTLMGELTQLEARRRAGPESLRQSTRRNRILSELEQIYGELDEASSDAA